MASVGVVMFRNSSSDVKSLSVLQEQSKNNNEANILNNNGECKVERKQYIIIKKKHKVDREHMTTPPTPAVTSLVNKQVEGSLGKASKRLRDENQNPTAPLAVARRNARERNRVRQVNNGFAALRRHIPEEVAEAFENCNSNRGPNKKLSKVETLRMAVEYIKSLERLLNISGGDSKENIMRTSMDTYPSPASSSPRDGSSFDQSYFNLNSPLLDEDEDSNPPTPLTYINNFQIIPPQLMYEDEENLPPLTPSSDMIMQEEFSGSQMVDASIQFMNRTEQEFTIIEPEHFPQVFNDESIGNEALNQCLDIKYVTPVRLSEYPEQNVITSSHIILSDPNNPGAQIILTQDEFESLSKSRQIVTSDRIIMRDPNNTVMINDCLLKEENVDNDDLTMGQQY